MKHDDDPMGVGLLMSPVRRALVDLLAAHRADPGLPTGMTAAQLARDLELHVSTVRFHADQLVTAGLLDADFTSAFGVGRPRKIYTVAEGSFDAGRDTEALMKLTTLLAETFTSGATPREVGRQWAEENVQPTDAPQASTPGEWLGKVGHMVDVLEEWGYTPELTTSDAGRTARVDLHHCPFIDLARSAPAVVCGVHRGIIDGAMHQLGEDDVVVSLEPFVGPDLCQAHITTRRPFRSRNPKTGKASGDDPPPSPSLPDFV